LLTVKLAENLWTCECEFVQRFRAYMNVYGGKVQDGKRIECVSNDAEIQSEPILTSDFCIEDIEELDKFHIVETTEDYLPLLAATLATFAFVLLILLAVFVYRNTLKVWLHAKYGVRVFDASKNQDLEKNDVKPYHFDAYLTYSPKDDAFTREIIAAGLEQESNYKLCLHHRDLVHNQVYLADTIIQATEASKRTILVLSENFLKSEWSRFDYKSGLHQALRADRKKLIVIMLGDVATRDIDPDLRLYLKTSHVLQWGESRFWEKLKYALPDHKKIKNLGSQNSGHSSVVSSTTSVLSSVASSHQNHQNQIYHQPRYATHQRPTSTVMNNNHHIYNMPGNPGQQQFYGGSLYGSTLAQQPAAVHI